MELNNFRTRLAVRVLARGTSVLDLDRDFRGGEEPEKARDSSPDYNQDREPGSPKYPTPSRPSSPEYPTNSRPGSPEYPTTSRPSSPEYPDTSRQSSPEYPTTTSPTGPMCHAMLGRSTTSSAVRRMTVGEPVYSVPGTSVVVSHGAGVQGLRPRASVEEAKPGMTKLRAEWEAEEEEEEDKSSPDSGLGRPGAGRGLTRSPAGSPSLRPGPRRGTSTSGVSSGTASSLCGSAGEEL